MFFLIERSKTGARSLCAALLFLLLPACLLAAPVAASPTGSVVDKMEPPHWWVGLGDGTLQLLLHGPGLAEWQPSLSDEAVRAGIQLQRVQRTGNPNYLFLDLAIAADAEPGRYTIRLQRGSGRRAERAELPYEFRARSGWQPQGLDPSDLMYLLMPDRFANGDPENDVVEGMQQTGLDRSDLYQRHGGDLAGMTKHLDYLADLGVTAVWPNPVLTNDQPEHSYHGYAVTDHYRIDPRFGSHADYLAFTAACRERGIKVVMDLIHNHVGNRHWWYQDLPSANWVHQWDSFTRTTYRAPTLLDPHASAYDRKVFGQGWFDTHMPDLNQDDPLLTRYLIQQTLWWIEEAGTDALRMDTWAYSDPDFLLAWSKAVAEAYPTLFVFGETWVHGGLVQGYFHGDTRLDKDFQPDITALTDFQAYYAITESATRDPGWTEGVNRLYYTMAKDYVYPHPERNVVFLDNHDLSRWAAVVKDNPLKIRMGLDWLMTVRGIPMLYYGTELALSAESDHHSGTVRQDFPGGWEGDSLNAFTAAGRQAMGALTAEIYAYTRALARWRAKTPVLHHGVMTQFVPVDGLYAYARHDGESAVLVLINGSDEVRRTEPERYAEVTDGFAVGVHPVTGTSLNLSQPIPLVPRSSMVLELR